MVIDSRMQQMRSNSAVQNLRLFLRNRSHHARSIMVNRIGWIVPVDMMILHIHLPVVVVVVADTIRAIIIARLICR